jgi:PPOX class probable FMN-dependent enzyme
MSANVGTIVRPEELGEHYKEPGVVAANKIIGRLDAHSRRFIELSPFCCLGTADEEGRQDVSPRGDVPGFVRVLDEQTLLLPDRPGNNRLDGMRNVLAHPRVGLLFLVPGIFDTLRVNGTAEITVDPDLLAGSAVQSKVPVSGLLVHVEEVFFHCGRALKRGRLWDPSTQVERSVLPPLAAMIKDQLGSSDVATSIDGNAPETYMNELY